MKKEWNKKKLIIITMVLILIVIALFIPYRTKVIDDQQTEARYAVLYTELTWVNESEENGYHSVYFEHKYFFFPQNLKGADELNNTYHN